MGRIELENVICEKRDHIAIITMNRPKSLNALNRKTLLELEQLIREIEEDDSIHAFIITGSGAKAFVAGADIHDLDHISPTDGLAFMDLGQKVFDEIENCSKPSIAAVNGYALGGGNELCMSCDIRIAPSNAKFGQPEIKLGNIPGWGGTQRLPRLIGKGRASQMIFSGEFITAAEAERYGLVNKVVEQDMLMEEAVNLAKKIAAKGSIALKMAKRAINEGIRSNVPTGLVIEGFGVGMCLTTEHQKEGVAAFLEKREAHFSGK